MVKAKTISTASNVVQWWIPTGRDGTVLKRIHRGGTRKPWRDGVRQFARCNSVAQLCIYLIAEKVAVCNCACRTLQLCHINDKKLSYCRKTAWHTALVNSGKVSRGMAAWNVSNSKSDHSISHIQFPISVPLQLCLCCTVNEIYHLLPKIRMSHDDAHPLRRSSSMHALVLLCIDQ